VGGSSWAPGWKPQHPLLGTPLAVWASAAVIASWSEASHRDVIASRYGKGVGAAGSGAVAVR